MSLTSLLSRDVGLAGMLACAESGVDAALVRGELVVTGRPGSVRAAHEPQCQGVEGAGSVEAHSLRHPHLLDQSCSCLREETRAFLAALGAVRRASAVLADLEELAICVQRAAGGVGARFTASPASYGCELAVNLVRMRAGNVSVVEGVREESVAAVRGLLSSQADELIGIAAELGAQRGWEDHSRVRRGRCVLRVDARQSAWRERPHAEVLALAGALRGAEVLGMFDEVGYILVEDPSEGAYQGMGRSERAWLLPSESRERARELAGICEALRCDQRGRGRRLVHLLPSARACFA